MKLYISLIVFDATDVRLMISPVEDDIRMDLIQFHADNADCPMLPDTPLEEVIGAIWNDLDMQVIIADERIDIQ